MKLADLDTILGELARKRQDPDIRPNSNLIIISVMPYNR
jgi:hypothetical protein